MILYQRSGFTFWSNVQLFPQYYYSFLPVETEEALQALKVRLNVGSWKASEGDLDWRVCTGLDPQKGKGLMWM